MWFILDPILPDCVVDLSYLQSIVHCAVCIGVGKCLHFTAQSCVLYSAMLCILKCYKLFRSVQGNILKIQCYISYNTVLYIVQCSAGKYILECSATCNTVCTELLGWVPRGTKVFSFDFQFICSATSNCRWNFVTIAN